MPLTIDPYEWCYQCKDFVWRMKGLRKIPAFAHCWVCLIKWAILGRYVGCPPKFNPIPVPEEEE